MSISSGFFDSRDHDRLYSAEEVSRLFDGLINDGIFRNYQNAFAIAPSTDPEAEPRTITIDTGRCWFNHTWMLNDEIYNVVLESNDTTFNRMDAIVIDVDFSDDHRETTIKYIKGTYDGKYPVLLRESFHCQYPLAYITVVPNATTIAANKINDRRGKSTFNHGTTGIEYGTPFSYILLGTAGIKTNLPGVLIEGFHFEDEEVDKENMLPNLIYGTADKM